MRGRALIGICFLRGVPEGVVEEIGDLPLIPFSFALAGLVWITAGAAGEAGEWWRQTWSFTKQVLPY
jgi:hypothetical protein